LTGQRREPVFLLRLALDFVTLAALRPFNWGFKARQVHAMVAYGFWSSSRSTLAFAGR
jgi:hypothetical protein